MMNDPGIIKLPNCINSSLVVLPAARLVAKRPAEHAGMAAVTHHHPGRTLHKHRAPAGIAAECHIIRMALKICLVKNINTELVAEIIPAVVIRIVTGAYRVEIELFQQENIFPHTFHRQRFPGFEMVLMTVHATDKNPFPIEQQIAAVEFDVAETDALRPAVDYLSPGVDQLHGQLIQRRDFRRPRRDLWNPRSLLRPVMMNAVTTIDRRLSAPDSFPGGIVQRGTDRIILLRSAGCPERLNIHAEVSFHAQNALARCKLKISVGKNILKISEFRGIEINAAVNTCHPPVILILDIGGIGPPDHFADQYILTLRINQRRQIKFGRQTRILAHSDKFSVEIDFQITFRPADMQHGPAFAPRLGQSKRKPVNAGRVVLRNNRRIVFKRHLHVCIDRFVGQPLHGPVGRNGNGPPLGILVFRFQIPFGNLFRRIKQAEPPFTVKRHPQCGRFPFQRTFHIRIRDSRPVCGQTVDLR